MASTCNGRADYGPNQVKPCPAGQKYETWHIYSFDTTERFQKGSPKILVNSLSENHVFVTMATLKT